MHDMGADTKHYCMNPPLNAMTGLICNGCIWRSRTQPLALFAQYYHKRPMACDGAGHTVSASKLCAGQSCQVGFCANIDNHRRPSMMKVNPINDQVTVQLGSLFRHISRFVAANFKTKVSNCEGTKCTAKRRWIMLSRIPLTFHKPRKLFKIIFADKQAADAAANAHRSIIFHRHNVYLENKRQKCYRAADLAVSPLTGVGVHAGMCSNVLSCLFWCRNSWLVQVNSK